MQRITLNLLIINRYIYSLSGDHNIDFEIGTESSDANVSESTTLSSFNSSLQQSFSLLLQKAKYGLTESDPLNINSIRNKSDGSKFITDSKINVFSISETKFDD